MSSTVELILVGILVTVAGAWAARAIWRSVRKGNICSSCSSLEDCPAANDPKVIQELGVMKAINQDSPECPLNAKKTSQNKANT